MNDGFSLTVGRAVLRLTLGDLTEVAADALVNAANSRLAGGGGVDGALHRAGGPAIAEECRRIRAERGGCPPGEAVLTTAGRLKARGLIHTVGPVWRGGQAGEDEVLRRAYQNSLRLAVAHGLRTVAFPSISTGAYGFPVARAARVALRALLDFLASPEGQSLAEVQLVLHTPEDYAVYRSALAELSGQRPLP
ncbi:MAG: O-acetyl-ADP-ribose deacetylase [Bacillota bacterium]|nr:O-acetyl-ADP-ribose deacetylase [Bacillota bacterium]